MPSSATADAEIWELVRRPSRMRRLLAAHPAGVDVTIALTCVCLTVVSGLSQSLQDAWSEQAGHMALVVGGAVGGGGALLWRRHRPITVALVTTAIAMVPGQGSIPFAAASALYALGAYARPRRGWMGFAATALLAVAASLPAAIAVAPSAGWAGSFLLASFLSSFLLLPMLLGVVVRTRRRYLAAIVQRASDLSRERDQAARLGIAKERARIAREMHDVVSHGLSVMVTLSEGAAADAEAGGSEAPQAMRIVAETGRASLVEMRRHLRCPLGSGSTPPTVRRARIHGRS